MSRPVPSRHFRFHLILLHPTLSYPIPYLEGLLPVFPKEGAPPKVVPPAPDPNVGADPKAGGEPNAGAPPNEGAAPKVGLPPNVGLLPKVGLPPNDE